jgi:hypothetical protein
LEEAIEKNSVVWEAVPGCASAPPSTPLRFVVEAPGDLVEIGLRAVQAELQLQHAAIEQHSILPWRFCEKGLQNFDDKVLPSRIYDNQSAKVR